MQQARQLRQQSPEAQLEGILQHPFHSPAAAGDGRDSLAAVPMAAAAALATQAAGALRQDASTYSGSLEALVLSWRLPDICNARCISDSLLAKIPTCFDDGKAYRHTFIWHVAEEVRAQLHQALLALGGSSGNDGGGLQTPALPDFSGMRNVAATELGLTASSSGSISSNVLEVQFTLCPSQATEHARQEAVQPNDVLLLSTKPVSRTDELATSSSAATGGSYVALLALVLGADVPSAAAADADSAAAVRYKAKVWAAPGSPEFTALSKGLQDGSSNSGSSSIRCTWWVSSLGNLARPMRTFAALQQLGAGSTEAAVAHPLLCEVWQQQWRQQQAAADPAPADAQSGGSSPLAAAVATYCQGRGGLNTSQQQVVLQLAQCAEQASSTVNSPSGCSSGRVCLVQGPPGTGKTATLVGALSVLGCCGVRVLATAPTNVAVCELASRYLQLLEASQFAPVDGISSGNSSSSSLLRATQQLSWGDVLLVCNDEQEQLSEALRTIHLPARVQRLMAVVGPSGLTGQLTELQHALSVRALSSWHQQQQEQACVQQDKDAVRGRDRCSGSSGESSSSTPAAFLAWYVGVLQQLQQALCQAATVVAQDLPAQHVRHFAPQLQELVTQLKQLVASLQLLQQQHKDNQGQPREQQQQQQQHQPPLGQQLAPPPPPPLPHHQHQQGQHMQTTADQQPLAVLQELEASRGSLAGLEAFAGTAGKANTAAAGAWFALAAQVARQCQEVRQRMPPLLMQQRPSAALQQLCLSSCRHLFCTVSTSGTSAVARDAGQFPVVVVDEAAQLVEAETAILLARCCCSSSSSSQQQPSPSLQLVLVGDPKQLPATVISQRAAQQGYSRSLFERLQQRGSHAALLLDVQYRCRPEISLFPRQQFYGGRLQDGPNVISSSYGAALLGSVAAAAGAPNNGTSGAVSLQPLLVLDVRGSFEERDSSSGSRSISNPMEVDAVLWLLRLVRRQAEAIRQRSHAAATAAASGGHVSVGIISPYRRQVAAVLSELVTRTSSNDGGIDSGGGSGSSARNPAATLAANSVWIGRSMCVDVRSVDGFQGQERDVIIMSCVRANAQGSIGFLADARRLNVALTRARYALLVVCNAATLAADPSWAALLRSTADRGLLRVLDVCGGAGAVVEGLSSTLSARLQQRRWQMRLLRGDTSAYQGSQWQVYFSKDFATGLLSIKDGHVRARMLQQLQALAKGAWPTHLRTHNAVAACYQDILHVWHVEGYSLLWSIDADHSTCTQVLKVWALLDQPSKVASWAARIQALLATYSDECLELCRKRTEQPPVTGAKRGKRLPAVGAHIRFWLKRQALAAASAQGGAVTAPAAAAAAEALAAAEVMAGALAQMKYYQLDGPLAARVVVASSESQVEALLKLSPEEVTVVHHTGSMLLAARSGTGKSTVIVHRLVIKALAFQAALQTPGAAGGSSSSSSVQLPQLLVTRSDKLASKLQKDVTDALACSSTHAVVADAGSMGAAGHGSSQLADASSILSAARREALPSRFSDLQASHYPLVLTMRQLLNMLAASMPQPFVPGGSSSSASSRRQRHICNADAACSSEDEEDAASSSGSSSDDEASVVDQADDYLLTDGGLQLLPSGKALRRPPAGAEVDYDAFLAHYWRRFDQQRRRELDPGMVFAEFLASIKGSEGSLLTRRGRLSRTEYVALAQRRASSRLTEAQRDNVYSLFLRYESLKARWGQYDVMDVTHHVLHQMRQHGYNGPCMQCVYVDEAQDLVMVQLALISQLADKLTEGLVIAGDTAQTVTRGVSFRFADISALLYKQHHGLLQPGSSRREVGCDTAAATAAAAAAGGSHDQGDQQHQHPHQRQQQPQAVAKLLTLRQNWRTQRHVLAVANALTDVMYAFFPDSVDKLSPEESSVVGDMPVLLLPGAQHDPVRHMFGAAAAATLTGGGRVSPSGSAQGRGGSSGQQAEALPPHMNAQTAVLVRDEAAAAPVRALVGDGALVLTVEEAKGLEFPNVVAYNLFSSCPAAARRLRLLYTFLDRAGCLPPDLARQPRFARPAFDGTKHFEFDLDLKYLYVVATRARSWLLLYEEDSNVHNVLHDFTRLWAARGSSGASGSAAISDADALPEQGLLEVRALHQDLLGALQRESSREEWQRVGEELFQEQKYERAEMCFRRAGDEPNVKLCRAERLMQQARRGGSSKAWLEAGRLYKEIGRWEKAGSCLQAAGCYREAADVFFKQVQPPQCARAASCYLQAGCRKEAAYALSAGGQIDNALEACLAGQLWEDGLALLVQHEQQQHNEQQQQHEWQQKQQPVRSSAAADNVTRRSHYVQACALALHKLQQEEAMMRFVALLPATRQHTFLINRGYVPQLAARIAATSSLQEAAAVCEAAGCLVAAAEYLRADGQALAAAQLLLRQARLMLLWPEAVPTAQQQRRFSTAQQARELLLRAQTLLRSAGAGSAGAISIVECQAEAAMLLELSPGFSSLQEALDWTARSRKWMQRTQQHSSTKLQVVVAVRGIAACLDLASSKRAGRVSMAAVHQLLQEWQHVWSLLRRSLAVLHWNLRSSQLSAQQEQLLEAWQYFLCVSRSPFTASLMVAEQAGMRWCTGSTAAMAAGGASTSSRASAKLQLTLVDMLQLSAAFLRQWICEHGQQLLGVLERHVQPSMFEARASSGAGADGAAQQRGLLVRCWQVLYQLHASSVQKSLSAPLAARMSKTAAEGVSRSATALASVAAMQALAAQVEQQRRHCLKLILAVVMAVPGLDAAGAALPPLLQLLQQQPSGAELLQELASGVLDGSLASSKLPASAPARTTPVPPPPQPTGLTYDRIGQVCLLLPWLEPSWLDRAVAQGKLVLKHPEAGLKTPPWLQLSMAGSWTMLAVRSNVLSPRSEWSHYPFQVAMWQCQGLRSYLQLLGLRSTAGGLKPATFLQLCETTAVLACAVATSLDNLVLPQGMAASCMVSPGARGLLAWTAYYGSTEEEQTMMESELLALGKLIAELLLTSANDLEGWCTDAAQLLESQPAAAGQGKAAAKQRRAAAAMKQQQQQQAVATQLFWLLFAIAANSRSSASLQHVLLDTLVRLPGAGGSSSTTALRLLPSHLRDCIRKLAIKASSASGQLQFDAVAEQLLSAAAALGQPWVVLYCCHIDDKATAWASSLPVLMVNSSSSSQQGGDSVPSFSVAALFDGSLQQQGLAGVGSTAASKLPSGKVQGPANQQRHTQARRHVRAATAAASTPAAGGAALQAHGGAGSMEGGSAALVGGAAAAGMAAKQPTAPLLTAWVLEQVQRWRSRAVWRLHKPLTLLEWLQCEARACLAAHHPPPQARAGAADHLPAAGSGVAAPAAPAGCAQQYCYHYLQLCCPLLVRVFEHLQLLEDAGSLLRDGHLLGPASSVEVAAGQLLDEAWEGRAAWQELLTQLEPRSAVHELARTDWLYRHVLASERLLQQQAALAASCKAVVMAMTAGEMAAALVPAANTTTIAPGNGSSRGSQAKATTSSKKKGGRR